MRVGKEVKREVLGNSLGSETRQPSEMTADERKAMAEGLMSLPKDKVLPAMRSAGLDTEADELERRMAEQHLADMRSEQLEGIMALPEDERLGQLIANGFDDEARELSQKMADEQAKEVSAPADAVQGTDAKEAVEPVVRKKKGGRPRKSSR
jgi:hypothetical protein